MTNTNSSIINAIDFILDSVNDDSIEEVHTIEEIEDLDEGTIYDFAEDYLFEPSDLRLACAIYRKFEERTK